MTAGELVVIHEARRRNRWTVGWQFEAQHGRPAHIQLLGEAMPSLVDGPVSASDVKKQYASELLPSTNDIVQKISSGAVDIDICRQVAGRQIDFVVARLNTSAQPDWIAAVRHAVGHQGGTQDRLSFDAVLRTLIGARLQITDNHRAPVRTEFEPDELATIPDLRDGSLLDLELHRLKNGDSEQRDRFGRIQKMFRHLTGANFDCTHRTTVARDHVHVTIEPVISIDDPRGLSWDVPLRRAGAGATEALLMVTLLANGDRCVFLDEPGVHLSPTAQRRLLSMLRDRRDEPGQAVWVTHNPDLVPVSSTEDLHSIVRLARGPAGYRVHTLQSGTPASLAATQKLLASAEIRAMLFAEALVIVEGPTEIAALSRWLGNDIATAAGRPLPSPDERNVLFVSADGDAGFGSLAGLADQMGVPWAIVADGPAMRPGSNMAKQLTKLARPVPQAGELLVDVVDDWAKTGVYTLADEFGDDGSKSGEIEAFFAQVDNATLTRVQKDIGVKKGARVGAAFANAVPVPERVVNLWASLLTSLELQS